MFQFLYILTSISYLLDYSRLFGCVVVTLWFWFHFPDYWSCWTTFHVFIGYLYILGEISIQILCPLLKIGVFVFLWLNYKSSSYILSTSPLLDTWFVKTFSHSLGCLFTFFMMIFEAQKLLILIKSNLSLFPFVPCAFGVYLRNHCLIQGH